VRRSRSDDELLDYARQKGSTVYHATCTCNIGGDRMAMVDDQLRVHGIEGLRVVGASGLRVANPPYGRSAAACNIEDVGRVWTYVSSAQSTIIDFPCTSPDQRKNSADGGLKFRCSSEQRNWPASP
jgi:hypothetical protein